jgi:hypothetical protein
MLCGEISLQLMLITLKVGNSGIHIETHNNYTHTHTHVCYDM